LSQGRVLRKMLGSILMALLTACIVAACEPAQPLPPEQEVYALRDGVGFRAGSSDVVKNLEYGQSVRARCDNRVCRALVNGSPATVSRADVADAPPPRGSRYVWGRFAGLKLNQQVTIQGYDPNKRAFEVDGRVWLSGDSLGDRPESATETQAREKKEAVARAEQAKEQREEARREVVRQREEAKLARDSFRAAIIATEPERQEFAKRLREDYLSKGADIKVSVSGKHAQRLSLEYPLINDVWLYQFQHNADVLDALRAKGFTEVDLSNGWNYGKRLTLR
jgi:hypothetical protein